MINKEGRQRQQRRINAQIRPISGRSIVSVTVSTPSGDKTYNSRKQVETHIAQHLQQRFSLGQRAPLHQGQLHHDFGNLGITEATTQLFEGRYTFPADCDEATKHYLQEARRIKQMIEDTPMNQHAVTVQEFTSFWASAKETTSSSKSGRHFGHYKAVIDDPALVTLHITNINLATTRG